MALDQYPSPQQPEPETHLRLLAEAELHPMAALPAGSSVVMPWLEIVPLLDCGTAWIDVVAAGQSPAP